MIHHTVKLWPVLKGIAITHAWNGQFALTPDFYPRLHRPAPGVWAALGYSGRGVAMAVSMGREIANSINGCPDAELPIPISPIKPIWGHRFWKWGVAMNVAMGRAQDAADRLVKR